jgi:hypothetical protein
MRRLIPRGFSANLVLVIWCLFGGVCQWGFESNIRTLMFKPVYEDNVDTAQDVLDRGLIPVVWNQDIINVLKHSDNQAYKQLAEIAVIMPSYWKDQDRIFEHFIQGNATHVFLGNELWNDVEKLGDYHFSNEVLETPFLPYRGWIVNKKWPLNDELAKHILWYQQVCYILFLLY